MKLFACIAALILLTTSSARAQESGLLGDWKSKAGSIIRVEACGEALCMRLVQVLNTGGEMRDAHNPDPALRTRPLCGLEIGSAFKPDDAAHASHGTLYDPKSGKTYHGNISVEGTMLHLRGYVGVPLFGESQDWARAAMPVTPCDRR